MSLRALTLAYLENPCPIWNPELTKRLLEREWTDLAKTFFCDSTSYSTAALVLHEASVDVRKLPLLSNHSQSTIYVELQSDSSLDAFLASNNLRAYRQEIHEITDATSCLDRALDRMRRAQPAYEVVLDIVRSIHLLEAESPDHDVSYSHPDIPFSIFVSVPEYRTEQSILRLAESILHEAMHLNLSLIEKRSAIIEPESIARRFYSPWRGQERPIRGVLHGVYVFRCIYEFFETLLREPNTKTIQRHCRARQNEIVREFESICEFPLCPGLTRIGASFAQRLLTL